MSSVTVHRRRAGQGASLVPRAMHRTWRGRIYLNRKVVHLGYFATRDEAIAAHAKAVQERLGERYLKSEDRPA
jgi:hypothetical protein